MVVSSLPHKKADIVQYIASMKAGIGKKKASMMVDLVGAENFFEKFSAYPMQFAVLEGITNKMLTKLQEKLKNQIAQDELFNLMGNDLPCDTWHFKKIQNKYRNNSALMLEDIRNNPFSLIDCGYSFEELDRLLLLL